MKKKLLFVIPSLEAGGAEKSLVNLLNTIDHEKYDVDLALFLHSGIFLKQLPSFVQIIDLGNDYKTFTLGLFKSISKFLKQKKIALAFSRLIYSIKNNSISNDNSAEQYAWNNLKESIPVLNKNYDAAIGFLEKSSIYFCIDCVKATKKIGWIHTNYDASGLNKKIDYRYFEKLNYIVTVSEECEKSLQKNFPNCKSKIKIIYNIVSPEIIHNMANEILETVFPETNYPLLTIGRLSQEKGLDLAIMALKIVSEKYPKIIWYSIGSGPQKKELEKMILDHQLEKKFILLGAKENPYPYLEQTKIYIQPSRYEGKSIAVDEAKILKKTIIVANFTSAKDQIDNLKNGLIVQMNPQSIAQGIIELVENETLQDHFKTNLSQEILGTQEEINKLYTLIND